jgi:hypothetical protein
MKSIKTLLKENNLKKENDYYELILDHFNRGNHIKCSNLFQDLKRSERVYFLCIYLKESYQLYIPIIKFFIKELVQN